MATVTRIGTFFGEKPVISASERYVAFVTTLAEFTNDANGATD